MKKSLLFASGAIVALSAVAAIPVLSPVGLTGKKAVIASDGRISEHVSKVVNPAQTRSEERGDILFESFEKQDGTIEWVPEGWKKYSKGDEGLDGNNHWFATDISKIALDFNPTDGSALAGVLPNHTKNADEWLVTPSLTIGEGQNLYFDAYFWPLYFFYTDSKHVAPDADGKYHWTNQEIISNFQVMVQVGDGEFEVLHDYAQDWMDVEYGDVMMSRPSAMQPYTVSLEEYVGKEIHLAFRYYGTEGDALLLDNVRVGLPKATVSYSMPFSTQYYGLTANNLPESLPGAVAVFPVCAPIEFLNTSELNDGEYTWNYAGADGNPVTSSDIDLTVSYAPMTDPEGEYTVMSNWHTVPTLNGEAPGYVSGSYKADILFMQTGGEPTYQFLGAEDPVEFGLLPFSPAVTDLAPTLVDYTELGDLELPVFGYSENTSRYWVEKKYEGLVHTAGVAGVMNFVYAPSAPLVVNGVNVNAFGEVADDAVFTIGIYPVNEEYKPADTPLATATCNGSDIAGRENGTNEYLMLPFSFDKPVIIDDSNPAYIVMLTGFDSGKCKYFVPLNSVRADQSGLCFGWIKVNSQLEEGGETMSTFLPVASFDNEYGEALSGGFAINLAGYYPWLDGSEDVTVAPGIVNNFKLNSFYAGQSLKIEAPSWIKARVEGRYNKAVLRIECTGSEGEKGEIIITAPGVRKVIKVLCSSASVSDVDTSDAVVTAVYNLDGTVAEGNIENLEPGIYIVRYSDGKVRKQVVRD